MQNFIIHLLQARRKRLQVRQVHVGEVLQSAQSLLLEQFHLFRAFSHRVLELKPGPLGPHAHRVKLRVRPARGILGLPPSGLQLARLLLRDVMMTRRLVVALLTLTDGLQPRQILQPLVLAGAREALLLALRGDSAPLLKRLGRLVHRILDCLSRATLRLRYAHLWKKDSSSFRPVVGPLRDLLSNDEQSCNENNSKKFHREKKKIRTTDTSADRRKSLTCYLKVDEKKSQDKFSSPALPTSLFKLIYTILYNDLSLGCYAAVA